ncbi:hypothetical protein ACVR0W_07605 [Streptococcus canis]|uniref:Uncharacterized protein n=1 Tax=Streptococcus canis FSL Z3-227 TaxID=482234 RepID=A0AAV3FV10_STRCB|nr:hypothetical protein [Streptococcus canis]EIQ82933.1 hypothetical protein SCAZ3_11240 [Streptococcus canis FSL Z3-227]MDV5988858.1 hypothetical protein [Streptococcus canis]QBX13602.1 hypothetical protein JavanS97_0023 [Streptococcus satellite phage Javan97]VEE24496.1 hypothetical membrane associated protein [Streptococcus canis]
MTTKKKSLLGIGYLSVAMLGASLLMAKPVSAEEMSESGDQAMRLVTQTGNNGVVEVIEVAENGEERILGSTQDPYFKGRDDGYDAGYQDGQKPGAPETPSSDIPEPQDIPSFYDESWYKNGYNDAYVLGYRNGWDDNHYIWSTLRNVWYLVTSYFY